MYVQPQMQSPQVVQGPDGRLYYMPMPSQPVYYYVQQPQAQPQYPSAHTAYLQQVQGTVPMPYSFMHRQQ